jgi:hypothetical protein
MKYRGRMKNGVVVLDEPNGLVDGALVEVEPLVDAAGETPSRGSAAAVLRHAGIWAGESAEVDRLLGELRETKRAEVEAQSGGRGQADSLD